MKNINLFTHIPPHIESVLDTLESAGYEAYLVGGCVRDAARGHTPNDYDITTNAKPEDMLRVFHGQRVIETGLKHGTLTVVSDGECVEITTYRIDGEYTDNRHPSEVSFTDDITLDLSRRDFTVNAMAYSPTAGLCDPFGGMKHLSESRIVCVGSPEARFREDGLRILRALRFASVLDFELDPATAAGIRSLSPLLRGISKERIYTELAKLLGGAGVARILSSFAPVLELCGDGVSAADFSACAESLASLSERAPECRIAYLCRAAADRRGESAKACARSYMKSLKTSAAAVRRCQTLAEVMGDSFPEDEVALKRMMGRLGAEDIAAYACLRGEYTKNTAAASAFLEKYRAVAAEDPCVRVSQLELRGDDVIRLTGARGAEVGECLSHLLEEVITGRTENQKDALKASLRRQVKVKAKQINEKTNSAEHKSV